jgi:hypothetical protein
LLDSASELVRDRGSTFVLGLAAIQPTAEPTVNLNIEVKAGYVIDLSVDPALETAKLRVCILMLPGRSPGNSYQHWPHAPALGPFLGAI